MSYVTLTLCKIPCPDSYEGTTIISHDVPRDSIERLAQQRAINLDDLPQLPSYHSISVMGLHRLFKQVKQRYDESSSPEDYGPLLATLYSLIMRYDSFAYQYSFSITDIAQASVEATDNTPS